MEEYSINGQKIEIAETFVIDNMKKYNQVKLFLRDQNNMFELYEEPDMKVFVSGLIRKQYLIFDERDEINAYVRITRGISKTIKDKLKRIFN